jgi:Cdc6-like AAA superfamily ATPase
MSLFNIVWSKYNLRDNPYFQEPLTISDGKIPISSFVGRKKECEEIIKMISLGEGRFLVTGDAGVGKTTLLNYVRAKARDGNFFSPEEEIELNRHMPKQEFVLVTLEAILKEIKREKLTISEGLMKTLEDVCDINSIYDFSSEEALMRLNYEKLKGIFKQTIKEVRDPRYKGIILHYDNLDNIKNPEEIESMFGELRDLFYTSNVSFFFVGNKFLPMDIGNNPRVKQIFNMSPVSIEELTFEDTNKILNERVKFLKKENNLDGICPHSKETLRILFELHGGNLRETLKSLSACVCDMASSNQPTIIKAELMKEILTKKIEEKLRGLTATDRGILKAMLRQGVSMTPTDVSKVTGKKVQNISSKYLPKLMRKLTIEIEGKEGRNIFYMVCPEVKWWNLENLDVKEIEDEESIKKKQRLLDEFS